MTRLTALAALLLAGCAHASATPPSAPPGKDQLELILPAFPGPGQVNLGALRGKVLLVDFWATWCGPCHEAATAYQKLYVDLRGQGLEVYGVSLDEDASQIPDFLKAQGVTYPIALDPSGAVSAPRFDLGSIPAVLIVDRTGKIRFTHAGFDPGELAQTTSEIRQLLAEPSPGS
jgi:peroxiredoxin